MTVRSVLGHPPGLAVLFATESWERFSYFGNAALLVLYMVKHLFDPGRIESVLGFASVRTALEFLFGHLEAQPLASQLFGIYTGLAYFMPILGGLLADRLLGRRRTVIIGGLLMAGGHFMMAFEPLLLLALLLLILGIGAFKPNVSVQVGALYRAGDPRRDRAYSIFYLGINIGALVAPLVCGTLAAQYGWHYGFAAAGVGMLVSLGIYLLGQRTLPAEPSLQRERRHTRGAAAPLARSSSLRERPPDGRSPVAGSETAPLRERRGVLTLIGVCAIVTLFWAAYDQQGNTILLWAEDFTDRSIDLGVWQGRIPSPWFLALNPLMVLLFTPFIVRLWASQGRHGRESPPIGKMAFGCLCLALANVLMTVAALTTVGSASGLWLLGYFALATVGELHLAPIGLALVSKLAPARMHSMMMGIWFAATLPGDILAGFLGGFWSTMDKASFYLMIAAIAALAAIALWILRSADRA